MDTINQIKNELKIIKIKNNTKFLKTKVLLITGASGSLGSEILKREAKKYKNVYALSRNLKRSVGNITWIKSDLSKINFGLSKTIYTNLLNEVDTVIHCAAEVNNLKTRHELFNNNVLSTINMIKFCKSGNYKKIHYASTLSVIISKYEKNESVIENKKLKNSNNHLLTGYAESKWQSEFLINKYLQNSSIYRYGLLIPKNEVLEKNHFLNVILKFAKKYKEFPVEYKNFSFDYSILNSNILKIENRSGIYNKSNNLFITLENLLFNNNIEVNWINLDHWQKKYNKKIIKKMFIKSKYFFFETTEISYFKN